MMACRRNSQEEPTMRGSWTKAAIRSLGAVALIAMSALPAAAQTTSGDVTGTVHDQQGAALPLATVTLTSNTRGTVLNAMSHEVAIESLTLVYEELKRA